jgi:23S rRNA (cytosine1962-C5)-methyltransferase
METAYEQFANRLTRVYKHLKKWARRTDVTCFRLYEKDIPDQPLIVDWYDGEAVVWAFERTRNETTADEENWLKNITAAVAHGLAIPETKIFLKRRFRQSDRQDGDGQYHRLAEKSHIRSVAEHGLLFEVNLSDYVDTGLFLDHRPTRQCVRSEVQNKSFLNLFAYTGAFSVYARAGGARATTTVDLSNTYCDWVARNFALNNQLPHDNHRIIRADCLQWLAAEKQHYDIIVCDPPTFSNSKSMRQTFRVDHDHSWLIARCTALLNPGGILYFSTNFRGFRLAADAIPAGITCTDISTTSVPEDFRNRKIHQCWRMVKA